MKEVKERVLFKITDDLIVKRGYVERVVEGDGEIDWLMNGRSISDKHVKDLLEERYIKICRTKIKKKAEGLERFLKYLEENGDN